MKWMDRDKLGKRFGKLMNDVWWFGGGALSVAFYSASIITKEPSRRFAYLEWAKNTLALVFFLGIILVPWVAALVSRLIAGSKDIMKDLKSEAYPRHSRDDYELFD